MQIILLERVAKLGSLGDIVNVRNGFGRNYLIPQGKAKRATEANKAEFAAKRAELERQQRELLATAQEKASRLDGFVLTVSEKASIDGRLFGSVTLLDIANAITKQGITISKSEVLLPLGPLKTLGEHAVDIVLHHDVTTRITVVVVADTPS